MQLVSATLPVRPGRRAGTQLVTVELKCLAVVACRGTLELTIPAKPSISPKGAAGSKRLRTIRLGVARFALRAGKTAKVKLALYSTVRARLAVAGAGGRVKASLTILTSAPRRRTQVHAVSLMRKRAPARG